jgi:hypothetical protein
MALEYSIKNGDSLSRLAKKFGVTVAELANANNIKDPDKIYIGDTLVVPDTPRQQLQNLVSQLLPTMMQPAPGMDSLPPQLQMQGQRQPIPTSTIPSPQSQALEQSAPEMMMAGVPSMLKGVGGLAMAGLARGLPAQLGKAGRIPAPTGYSNVVPLGNSGGLNQSIAQALLASGKNPRGIPPWLQSSHTAGMMKQNPQRTFGRLSDEAVASERVKLGL